MRKNFILLSIGLLFFFNDSKAQNEEKAEVIAVIEIMFDAMREGDVDMLAFVFHSSARLQTTAINKEGKAIFAETEISKFIEQIANKPSGYIYDEKILEYKIFIDGNLATAWTPYEFYYNGNFSHCGVNAFHLVKTEEGWKITQITDTRRREDCK